MSPDGHLYSTFSFDPKPPPPSKARTAGIRTVTQQRLDRILRAAGSEALTEAEAMRLAKLPRKQRKAALAKLRKSR